MPFLVWLTYEDEESVSLLVLQVPRDLSHVPVIGIRTASTAVPVLSRHDVAARLCLYMTNVHQQYLKCWITCIGDARIAKLHRKCSALGPRQCGVISTDGTMSETPDDSSSRLLELFDLQSTPLSKVRSTVRSRNPQWHHHKQSTTPPSPPMGRTAPTNRQPPPSNQASAKKKPAAK